jgi:hypothetical protein
MINNNFERYLKNIFPQSNISFVMKPISNSDENKKNFKKYLITVMKIRKVCQEKILNYFMKIYH